MSVSKTHQANHRAESLGLPYKSQGRHNHQGMPAAVMGLASILGCTDHHDTSYSSKACYLVLQQDVVCCQLADRRECFPVQEAL